MARHAAAATTVAPMGWRGWRHGATAAGSSFERPIGLGCSCTGWGVRPPASQMPSLGGTRQLVAHSYALHTSSNTRWPAIRSAQQHGNGNAFKASRVRRVGARSQSYRGMELVYAAPASCCWVLWAFRPRATARVCRAAATRRCHALRCAPHPHAPHSHATH
ncbi:MAG: hypothetical protein J3K34DRAFT_405506 [Monoraphidium minutum]|nr:MAG: hypothetical protein J3K34DRAFT_405506 [Monoraphidium minutum]